MKHVIERFLTRGFVAMLGMGLISACGKKAAEIVSVSDLSDSANLASEQVMAIAQSFDSGAIASHRRNTGKTLAGRLQRVFLPEAVATNSCNAGGSSVSACTQSGSNYVIQRTYNDCSLGGGRVTLSGSASFTYSAAGCSMIGVTNRSVTRTVNLSSSSTGRLGSSLSISSENATDYRGNTIGGGQTLTVNAAAGTFSFSVGGVTRKLTTGAGRTLFSIATRTIEPFSASGSSLSSLTVSGGSLEVIHNQAQYVLTLSASNVAFSASCTCPVSGVMSGAFSGSVSGTATITYTGCGTADVTTSDGATTAVTLDSCGA